ncbi:flavocytochrome c [Brevibacillus laterosporus]|uniref:flavocytochrome c n=1 Tax=Brevibacillus laterosporus TaxID=1465 RepID=UPI0003B1878D|nr:flavocytochrome c [Brevibacillus laterosporus]ERM16958.1 fumarate reductase [Brevibacillus laterosporus PE36]
MKKWMSLMMAAFLAVPVLSGCGSATTPGATEGKATTETATPQDESTDIVVIGAGGAGLSAAVEATNAGAKVIVLEKMPMVGGNTTRATGGLNAAGTEAQKKKGIEDSQELFYQDTMKGGYNKNNPELVKILTTQAKDSVVWLESLGADLSDVGRAGGASVSRIHRPTGGAAVGSNVISTLKNKIKEQNVDVRVKNKAVAIIKDQQGKVTGVKAENKDGKAYTINAKAVILATGGFSANQEMVISYKPELKGFATTNHPGALGEGITLGESVGANLVDMAEIQTHPTVVPEKGVMVTEAVRGNGAILINKDGKRFINELLTRDVVSKGILDQKDGVAYLFFDDGLRKGLKAVEEYFNMQLVTEADSVEELAGKIGVDKDAMMKSVKTYNDAVAAKQDKEFKRDDLPLQLNQGKVYAIQVTPAVHHTMGGLQINTNAEVMNKEGQIIKGLYAAGEVTGGVHGGNRLGGNAMADIVTFGRIAGQNAAKAAK